MADEVTFARLRTPGAIVTDGNRILSKVYTDFGTEEGQKAQQSTSKRSFNALAPAADRLRRTLEPLPRDGRPSRHRRGNGRGHDDDRRSRTRTAPTRPSGRPAQADRSCLRTARKIREKVLLLVGLENVAFRAKSQTAAHQASALLFLSASNGSRSP